MERTCANPKCNEMVQISRNKAYCCDACRKTASNTRKKNRKKAQAHASTELRSVAAAASNAGLTYGRYVLQQKGHRGNKRGV